MPLPLPTSPRHAGRDLLSLALIDTRNALLRWLAAFERETWAGAAAAAAALRPDIDPPLWLALEAAWFQEYWIARNVQRSRGEACDPTLPRLASIEPQADGWLRSPVDRAIRLPAAERWQAGLPPMTAVRQYLVDTLETTLDLLASADEGDAALYFFRLALFHEEAACESLARTAQAFGVAAEDRSDPVALAASARAATAPHRGEAVVASGTGRLVGGRLLGDIAIVAPRPPLLFPATRHRLGVGPEGFAFDNERRAHEVAVPEFEIDAQPVSWSQYAEFAEDGGYDDERWWSVDGWAWLQAGRPASAVAGGDSGPRRAPRHVEQLRRGVVQRRFGRALRLSAVQPALHLSWYEADAWCRWAGRRLPAEVEWEHAAVAGASRGFRHGDAWEWTASRFGPFPGFAAGPWRDYSEPSFGRCRVLRGASFATRSAFCDARFRLFAAPSRDDLFSGFRSCAG